MNLRSSPNFRSRICSARFAPFVYLLLTCLAAPASSAAERINWRSEAEVRQELESQIGINWPNNPLRSSLSNLAQARRVAIWLDRRIDPDQQINFKAKDATLRDVLRDLAGQLNAGVCLVGPVVYIGPKGTVANLPAQSAERRKDAGKLPAAGGRKLSQSRPWQWDELAEPRELLKELAAEGGLTLANADKLPHDLWPAGDFPALSLCDRLSLVLAGFDQTFTMSSDGASLEILPYPAVTVAAVERQHLVKGNVAEFAEQIAQRFPTAKIRVGPGRIFVTATDDEHAQIDRLLKPTATTRPAAGAEVRYTLKIDNKPVGDSLRAIAKQVEMELKLAPDVTEEMLGQRVSFQVKDATLEELFRKVLEPAGLACKISGKKLDVFEKPQ